jgi:hypothetical protein
MLSLTYDLKSFNWKIYYKFLWDIEDVHNIRFETHHPCSIILRNLKNLSYDSFVEYFYET